MAYLSKDELFTHLYSEVVKEINRDDLLQDYAAQANFPVTGAPTIIYHAIDTDLYYKWVTNAYAPTNYSDAAITAITAAQEEASGYLTAYDQAAIFGAAGNDRNPILFMYVKDIAVWHYIQLSNPGINLELRRDRYEKAISWLGKVQRGDTNPNLPYPALPADETIANNYIKTGSNTQRITNF